MAKPATPISPPLAASDRAEAICSIANVRTFLHELASRFPTVAPYATMANLNLTLALDRIRQELEHAELVDQVAVTRSR